MSDNLLSYFETRFSRKQNLRSENGTFITISRETGCNATDISRELVRMLIPFNPGWKFINKEVLEQAASKLRVDQSKINYIFESKKKSQADEILAALSNRYYKNDKIVRKTIHEVLEFYAQRGNVIIVGRAGAPITQHLENGFHVRLIAPLEWRLQSMKQKLDKPEKELLTYILETDRQRVALFEDFCRVKMNEFNFDLTVNCSAFGKDQAAKLILYALQMKKLIASEKVH